MSGWSRPGCGHRPSHRSGRERDHGPGIAHRAHQELVELIELAERPQVRVTAHRYALDAIHEAMEDLREGRIVGRAILVP